MENLAFEDNYESTFREKDVKELSELISKRVSLELVGMKRVGINNFLRFFLKHIKSSNSFKKEDNLFILVDLNDLIERDLFSFWRLTLKRIVDVVDVSSLNEDLKNKIDGIFSRCIQSGDFFLTFDGVKEIVSLLSRSNINTTLFLTRFDRIADVASLEFFNNLQSLKNAGVGKLSFVFTSFRELAEMAPNVFDKNSLTVFSKAYYIKPLNSSDSEIMLDSFLETAHVKITDEIKKIIINLSGGHAQYLQISSVICSEIFLKNAKISQDSAEKIISEDERINLLSEELWESLSQNEKNILKELTLKRKLLKNDLENNQYLLKSAVINDKNKIFSPLFEDYIEKIESIKGSSNFELSKKEFLLYSILKQFPNEICDREKIVEYVWPEYKEYGVSDWSIDRLVARVRNKLKKQNSKEEIITVRTRGYKLVTNL